MTQPIDTELAATGVARNFGNLFATLRASIVQQLWAIWFAQDTYRDAGIDPFLETALPIVQAGQETASSATATYLQMQMEILGITSTVDPPSFSEVTGAAIRNGIPPEEVYARPFKEVWDALSRGKSIQDAVADGANRLRQLVETDIQLSHTHTARNVLSRRNDVVGFRRVPQGIYTCALCLIASTQRYHKFDLMPIHPGCDCRVAPIVSETPVRQVIDPELLEQIHKAIQDQFGISARDARVLDYRKIPVIHNHGEYGPTLAVAGQNWTSL